MIVFPKKEEVFRMRNLFLCLAMLPGALLGQPVSATYSYSYSGLPIRVLPSSYNTWSYANVYFPRSMVISDVRVGVQVQYNGVGDLNVYLYSPQGTRTKLLERNCGSLQNIETTFSDDTGTRYASYCPQEAGRGPFRGNEPLANSRGQNALGYWRLGVENNGSQNSGFFTGFTVTVTGTAYGPPTIVSQSIVSQSSFQSGAVAPGELLLIVGANLGPTTPVLPTNANYPTSLDQTSVTFDGVAAPLGYVSDEAVIVQAPSNLTPGNTTKIQVQSYSGSSVNISLPVVPAMPGVFTYQAGPAGQIEATNQDGSVNGDGTVTGSDVPAAKGTTIQVMASGLGTVAPAVADGNPAPASPASKATLPITAVVAGMPATVTSAVLVPGQVGMFQVSVVIPANTPSGAVPLVLMAGGNPSQSGATIQIQ
jgi:uncharacterized protein (TIGR03437 family)